MPMTSVERQLLERDPLLLTEKDLQTLVIETARMFGWRHYHTFNSRRSSSGFPDLVLVHEKGRRIVFAELKSGVGKVSDSQREWLRLLAHAGADVHVWRPPDWDAIVQVLTEFSGASNRC